MVSIEGYLPVELVFMILGVYFLLFIAVVVRETVVQKGLSQRRLDYNSKFVYIGLLLLMIVLFYLPLRIGSFTFIGGIIFASILLDCVPWIKIGWKVLEAKLGGSHRN